MYMAMCQKWAKTFYIQGVIARHSCSIPKVSPCLSSRFVRSDKAEQAMACGRPL